MPVKIFLRDCEYEVNPGYTLNSCLEKIGINPVTILATRQDELITEDEILREGEVIKLIAVISGG